MKVTIKDLTFEELSTEKKDKMIAEKDKTLRVNDNNLEQSELADYLSRDAVIEKGVFYVLVPASTLDESVPVHFPHSQTFGDVVTSRTWREYAPFHDISISGKDAIIRCVHVKSGSRCGDGLSDYELKLWIAEFGDLIVLKEYNKLMATEAWKDKDAGDVLDSKVI